MRSSGKVLFPEKFPAKTIFMNITLLIFKYPNYRIPKSSNFNIFVLILAEKV